MLWVVVDDFQDFNELAIELIDHHAFQPCLGSREWPLPNKA
jgi:hypothetical protein